MKVAFIAIVGLFVSTGYADTVTPIAEKEFFEIVETAITAGSLPKSCGYEIEKNFVGVRQKLIFTQKGNVVFAMGLRNGFDITLFETQTKDGLVNDLVAEEKKKLKLNETRRVFALSNKANSAKFQAVAVHLEQAKPVNPLKPEVLGWVFAENLIVCD